MAKKNPRQTAAAQTVETTTIVEQSEPQQPEAVEAPANDAASSPDLTGLDDKALHALLAACLAEVKTRKAEAEAALPPIGSTVRILAGKFADLEGTLVSRARRGATCRSPARCSPHTCC